MKAKNVVVGMRVFPFRKTQYCKLKDSDEWKRAREKGQHFLYVIEEIRYPCPERNRVFLLSADQFPENMGEHFHARDFIPYNRVSYWLKKI